MEEQLTTGTVIINVLIQLVNLTIFFLGFKYLLGDKVIQSLEKREHLMNKLKNAEHEYNKIIEDAKIKGNEMLTEVMEKQKTVIKESEVVVSNKSKEILDSAKKKADDIIKNAELQAQKTKKELEDNRETSVKHASKIVVKKIIGDDEQLKDAYLNNLVKEAKTSTSA